MGITFEEIHRNGAIAYAIYNYIRHTGDNNYIVDYGLELLIALARFWSQRASFSEVKQNMLFWELRVQMNMKIMSTITGIQILWPGGR